MATKKPEVTWEQVLSTLAQIQALTEALIAVIGGAGGVSSAPDSWPTALYVGDLRKGCAPRPKKCPSPPRFLRAGVCPVQPVTVVKGAPPVPKRPAAKKR